MFSALIGSCLPETESHRGAEGATGIWEGSAEEPGEPAHWSDHCTHWSITALTGQMMMMMMMVIS